MLLSSVPNSLFPTLGELEESAMLGWPSWFDGLGRRDVEREEVGFSGLPVGLGALVLEAQGQSGLAMHTKITGGVL